MEYFVSINVCKVQQSSKASETEITWEMLLMPFMLTAPERKKCYYLSCVSILKEVYYTACSLQSLKYLDFTFFP